jgi:hypothetical protein
MRFSRFVFLCTVVTSAPSFAVAQDQPTGLAVAALANADFHWIHRETPGFRVYFLADSYPARHQDSLLQRLPAALANARQLLSVQSTPTPIDLFFVESRPQMEALIGGRATGFAQPSARAVFIMTNPEWRGFERHEIMHVVAAQAMGPIAQGNDWLREGLAQFADGRCGAYTNGDVALALNRRHGWIPFEDVINRFRQLPDLRGYLQAAAFVQYLHERFGPAALQPVWSQAVGPDTRVAGVSLMQLEREWREGLRGKRVTEEELSRIEEKGCG